MKKMITATLLASSLIFSSLAMADDHSRVDKKIQHMTKALKLSDDQVKNIKPILVAQDEKIREIKKQDKDAIASLLNEKQASKFEKMKKGKRKGKKCDDKKGEK